MNNLFCPHCRSGYDPVLKDSTWSCGVRFNDTQWRTKECYKRNLELANEHIKRMKVAGDALAQDHNPFTFMDWQRAKEDKP